MFCNTMFWIVGSELIKFETKYPYMYYFGISYNAWIWTLSKLISMLVMSIMPHAFPSAYRIMLSMLP